MDTPGPSRSQDGTQPPASSFQACDACRARKIRCDQLLALPIADHDRIPKCANCERRGVEHCTYKHSLKKRGPQPGSTRGWEASPSQDGTNGSAKTRQRRKQSNSSTSIQISPRVSSQASGHEHGVPVMPLSPVTTTYPETFRRPSMPLTSSISARPLSHLSGIQQRFSFNAANPLEAVLPRDLMLQIISLFFHYLYPLIPLVHRPSFEADLEGRREEREGEQEWTALVLITLASTVAQLPSVLIPLEKSHAQALIQRCYLEATKLAQVPFPVPSPSRCCFEYLASTVALMLGSRATSRSHRSVMWAHVMELRMHEESSYTNLDEVERQVRRRVFWVAYNADRTAAAIGGMPVFVQEDDLSSVANPMAIDDTTIFEPSEDYAGLGQTPLMSGFVYTVKLCRFLGEALNKRSQDRCRPPRGLALQMRINEITALGDQTETLMNDCPRELMLDDGETSAWYELGGLAASVPIRYRDGFLVQATNIYITQHMVAYIIAQYRADLMTVQRLEHRDGLTAAEISSIWSPSPSQLSIMTKTAIFAQDGRRLTKTLLKIVKACPIQALAVNSHHVVPKIRCVASALLDMTVDSFDPMGLATWRLPESSRDEAANYLAEFFTVLSKIETACTLPENPEV